ncbi:hypothetical protein AGLY_002061 [Aphis glycines]|uniref:DUF4371 domain-containing protein n=1 Tax=Aphis glycines TaxID=307491 RepID=A0A6G0U3I0_APHGL|nr:hypothetical protein AGLY_002061 [Aphis glycines]
MAGVYLGLQARIKEIYPLAQFIPCSAHSLNLVGECAVNSCKSAVDFFCLLQSLYNFFSISTHRWEKLKNNFTKPENVSLKNLSDTRWPARHEACISLNKNWNEIILTLTDINNDTTVKPITRCEAKGLLTKLISIETALMAHILGDIMERFYLTSKKLQSIHIDLESVIILYRSLIQYVSSLREMFDLYEIKTKEKSGIKDYQEETLRKKKKINDRLNLELNKRVSEKFSFFFNITKLSSAEIYEKAENLQTFYKEDLGTTFSNECVHFSSFLLSLAYDEFPDTISYLRSKTTEERLNCLAILTIESDLTNALNYDDVINLFANEKARRKL